VPNIGPGPGQIVVWPGATARSAPASGRSGIAPKALTRREPEPPRRNHSMSTAARRVLLRLVAWGLGTKDLPFDGPPHLAKTCKSGCRTPGGTDRVERASA
jgi:hypothetical protein